MPTENREPNPIDVESFKYVLQAGMECMKSLLLISGGGCVALLTLLGYSIKAGGFSLDLGGPIGCFTGATLCSAVAMGITHFSQTHYFHFDRRGNNQNKQTGDKFRNCAIRIMIGGGVLFCFGSIWPWYAIENSKPSHVTKIELPDDGRMP